MQRPTAQQCTARENKPSTVAVRYGYLAFLGEFQYSHDGCLCPGTSVLVETDRGLELGTAVCYTSPVASGVAVESDQVDKYVQNSGEEYFRRKVGKLIRAATDQDLREQEHILADAENKKRYCAESAAKLGMKMKIVCVEHLFGGERIIFYFTSDGRIDFRQLVRDLAREYQTRIELRQIGARDEARLLADYEICGRQCCCKSVLKVLRPVNMKMAKLQKATLDPSKVSGRCGRLRCCLAFEHKSYERLVLQLPRIGAWVETSQGRGRVRDRHVLTQLVQVVLEDNRLLAVPVEELSPAEPRKDPKPAPAETAATGGSETATEAKSAGTAECSEDKTTSDKPPRRRRGRRSRRKKSQ